MTEVLRVFPQPGKLYIVYSLMTGMDAPRKFIGVLKIKRGRRVPEWFHKEGQHHTDAVPILGQFMREINDEESALIKRVIGKQIQIRRPRGEIFDSGKIKEVFWDYNDVLMVVYLSDSSKIEFAVHSQFVVDLNGKPV